MPSGRQQERVLPPDGKNIAETIRDDQAFSSSRNRQCGSFRAIIFGGQKRLTRPRSAARR
jgi:hypothetical protein